MKNPLKMRRRLKAIEAGFQEQQIELARLRTIRNMAGQLIEMLNDGQVDYKLVERLERLIDARDGA